MEPGGCATATVNCACRSFNCKPFDFLTNSPSLRPAICVLSKILGLRIHATPLAESQLQEYIAVHNTFGPRTVSHGFRQLMNGKLNPAAPEGVALLMPEGPICCLTVNLEGMMVTMLFKLLSVPSPPHFYPPQVKSQAPSVPQHVCDLHDSSQKQQALDSRFGGGIAPGGAIRRKLLLGQATRTDFKRQATRPNQIAKKSSSRSNI
ncbi:hypothetical protein C8F01DRAFT_1227738 [Mycena amicta]|nr:hypothetical protein C8F01DRAFT_1227738 [Mycena amicta]